MTIKKKTKSIENTKQFNVQVLKTKEVKTGSRTSVKRSGGFGVRLMRTCMTKHVSDAGTQPELPVVWNELKVLFSSEVYILMYRPFQHQQNKRNKEEEEENLN